MVKSWGMFWSDIHIFILSGKHWMDYLRRQEGGRGREMISKDAKIEDSKFDQEGKEKESNTVKTHMASTPPSFFHNILKACCSLLLYCKKIKIIIK